MDPAFLRRMFQRIVLVTIAPVSAVGLACETDDVNITTPDVDPCNTPYTTIGACKTFCVDIDAGIEWADAAIGDDASLPTLGWCQIVCGVQSQGQCRVLDVNRDRPRILCYPSCTVTGRRPRALAEPALFERETLGTYFAQLAYLEAASVDAFKILRTELAMHRAPPHLIRAAGRAAGDEIRHARIMCAIAHRFGGVPLQPRRTVHRRRSLQDMAQENAVEGCVRESFGALLATYQASAARDPIVRAAFARIAHDETRHATLGWDVASWLRDRLDGRALARIDGARHRAIRALATSLDAALPREFAHVVGLPDRRKARAMFDQMAATLWSSPPS